MAWINLSSQKTTDPSPLENIRDLPDADLDRVALWAGAKYYPTGLMPDGVTPVTGSDVFLALTDDIYATIKRECEAWYLVQAEAAARATVPPIDLTKPETP